ncbi:MAG: DegT/DnrJ/EryC1/StrS family aminotransferase, partial [Candidatus Omnitrophota bacterium]|nr:DegT/DnrJ/EryC1/StrS family aminotransferase [Candidatus Omnitrophota bacterium]
MNFTTLNPRNIIKIPNFRIVLRPKDKKFILKKIQEVLASNRWTAGRQNAALEEAFEKHIGFPYAAAVNNGGAGLVAVLQGLGLPKGSLILCPTLTAAPTAHAILAAGMRVVFADSSLDDLGLDLGDVKRKLDIYKDKIRAVICVHIGGWISPRIGELNKLCKKYGV